jgi:hypothetical protein
LGFRIRVAKTDFLFPKRPDQPIPVTALSKAWVCGRSLAENAGSNPAGVMDIFLL